MIDGAFTADHQARPSDERHPLDELSMRVLELGIAAIALLAVLILTVAR